MSEDRGRGSYRLDHIGIAVPNLEKAREEYARILGCSPSPVEEVPGEKVRVSFFEVGESRIELLEPTAPDSPVYKFLERGRSGVHHIALAVEDEGLDRLAATLGSLGLTIAGGGVHQGSDGSEVLFLHPKDASGVLIEFTRRSET